MDSLLIHLGMTHPDIWLMWAAIVMTPLNTIGLAVLWYLWKRRDNSLRRMD